ncbi:MAG: GDP-L-fucose synthase [Pseudomonadota bacterium]
MNPDSRVYIAGHSGLVGNAIKRYLEAKEYTNLITRTHAELDLCNTIDVNQFFAESKPDYVFMAAAVVGGIHANDSLPVNFLQDNLQIQTNVIQAAFQQNVKKLAFLGSTCIYPRDCPQPIKEDYLLTGPLEKTNEWYAIAKIAGIKLCQAYRKQFGFNAISMMPTNLYGPGDNFDLLHSHVLPALIRKFHEGKINHSEYVEVWGSGKPFREFLYIDDMAEACCFLMQEYDEADIINLGTGMDISIQSLAELIREIVNFDGMIKFNTDKPDGTPKKLTDVSRINALGWHSKTALPDGIQKTYEWYKSTL